MPSEWPEKVWAVRRWSVDQWRLRFLQTESIETPQQVYVPASRLEEVEAERDKLRPQVDCREYERWEAVGRAEKAESQLHALRGVLEEEVERLTSNAQFRGDARYLPVIEDREETADRLQALLDRSTTSPDFGPRISPSSAVGESSTPDGAAEGSRTGGSASSGPDRSNRNASESHDEASNLPSEQSEQTSPKSAHRGDG